MPSPTAARQWASTVSRESYAELESHAGRGASRTAPAAPPAPATAFDVLRILKFWRAAGPDLWFAKNLDFDRRFREEFLPLHEAAARGDLSGWSETAEGALALVLLLDQFPRNAFRGTPRMYRTDWMARQVADAALKRAHDRAFTGDLGLFLYLPFAHSEKLADQDRSVALARRLGEPNLSRAERHRGIIARFGRFPHRNPILGRPMTAEEQRYLDEGGFAG